MARQVNNAEELKAMLDEAGSKLVIIDFYASWCAPCKIMSPIIEEIAGEDSELIFLKVDINRCEDLAEEYDIVSMPTFVFLREKEILCYFIGANVPKFKDKISECKSGRTVAKH